MKGSAMRGVHIVVLIAFGITLFVTIVTAVTLDDPQSIIYGEFVMRWIPQAVGVFIASIAALGLLLKCLSGANLEQLSPFVLPLLAGLLLMSVHWALAISVGLIAFAIVVKHIVANFSRPGSDGKRAEEI